MVEKLKGSKIVWACFLLKFYQFVSFQFHRHPSSAPVFPPGHLSLPLTPLPSALLLMGTSQKVFTCFPPCQIAANKGIVTPAFPFILCSSGESFYVLLVT